MLNKMNPLVSGVRHLSLAPSLLQAKNIEVPKKPATPWVNYFRTQMPEFKKSNPNLAVPEIMRKISVAWGQVSEQEKSKLQAMYLKEKEMYQRKLAKVPEDVLANAKASKDRKKASKQKESAANELKALYEKTKKPSRNVSAYLFFAQDKRSQLPANMTPTEKMKKLGLDWSNASESVRRQYEQKASQDLARYQRDLEAWQKKIEKDGTEQIISELQQKVSELKKRARN